MDPTRLELSPERLQRLQHLVEEIRRRLASYPPQPRRRTHQYPSGQPNPPWQPARHRRHRRGCRWRLRG